MLGHRIRYRLAPSWACPAQLAIDDGRRSAPGAGFGEFCECISDIVRLDSQENEVGDSTVGEVAGAILPDVDSHCARTALLIGLTLS